MELFVGLDVSLNSIAICVLSSHGKVHKETTSACEPDDLIAFLRTLQGDVACIGLEAGPLSQLLYRHLVEARFETVLMESRQVKGALKAMPIKTDRRDAEGIARLFHMGWFRPVHCRSISAQEMRTLLSVRKAIVQAITNLELSIGGILRNFGLKFGRVSEGGLAERVMELAGDNLKLHAVAKPILDVRRALRHELASSEVWPEQIVCAIGS